MKQDVIKVRSLIKIKKVEKPALHIQFRKKKKKKKKKKTLFFENTTKTLLLKCIENFTTKKLKVFRLKNSDIFHISAQNINVGTL